MVQEKEDERRVYTREHDVEREWVIEGWSCYNKGVAALLLLER